VRLPDLGIPWKNVAGRSQTRRIQARAIDGSSELGRVLLAGDRHGANPGSAVEERQRHPWVETVKNVDALGPVVLLLVEIKESRSVIPQPAISRTELLFE